MVGKFCFEIITQNFHNLTAYIKLVIDKFDVDMTQVQVRNNQLQLTVELDGMQKNYTQILI